MDFRTRLKRVFYPFVIFALLALTVFFSLFVVSKVLGIGLFLLFDIVLLLLQGFLILVGPVSFVVAVWLGARSLLKRLRRGEKLSDIVFQTETECPNCGSLKLGFTSSDSIPSPESGKGTWRVTCYDCGAT